MPRLVAGRAQWWAAAAALLPLAALGWWLSAGRMDGMDAGPGTALGTFGWFIATWLVMMAAMMLPALTPALSRSLPAGARTDLRRVLAPAGFVIGYLVVWVAAGGVAYGLLRAGRALVGNTFEWHSAGRWLSVAVVAFAAAYQLSPPKRRWLARCRAEFLAPEEAPTGRPADSVRSGLRAGGRCLGSSWALMLVLFALGAMSLVWMAVVAVLIAAERLLPAVRAARVASAGALAVLAVGVAAAPGSVPGLTIPGSAAAQHAMSRMGHLAPARPMAPGRGASEPMHMAH
jgi:predicted metal-binding membrane protein